MRKLKTIKQTENINITDKPKGIMLVLLKGF